MNKGKMENKTQNLTVTLTVLVPVYLILISIELGLCLPTVKECSLSYVFTQSVLKFNNKSFIVTI